MDVTLTERPKRSARVTAVVSGRGRVGKTVVANVIAQFCQERGADLRVWNADRQNETHSLSSFHAEASRPPSDDSEEKRLWLEDRFGDQVAQGYDAVLDLAGGDPLVRQIAGETRLIQALARRGTRLVSWQVLGPEVADLDYLKLSMEGGLFMPEATLIVLNGGLVRHGRSVPSAFKAVSEHPVCEEALGRGAKMVWFPALTCMSAVTDRGLCFRQAATDTARPEVEPLSFLDQSRVQIFWEDTIPAFFEKVPAEWMPAMPAFASAVRLEDAS